MTDSFRVHIARPELYARFDTAVVPPAGHVLRITAPAGSGKTELVTEWLGHLHRSNPRAHIGRLTITGPDSGELSTALATCLGVDESGPEADSAARLITALGAREHRTVLVIDDAHEITDPKSITFLEEFLHNAPGTLTTVLLARRDPPLRWHGMELHGRVSQLSATDLVFTEARARQMCDRLDCGVSDAELATIMRLTRGWAALVRIGVRHLAEHRDRSTALAELALVPPAIADLFAEEIVGPLPEHLRRFVRTMSVPVTFTAAQAEYLTGTTAQPLLGELLRLGFPMLRTAHDNELWVTFHPLLRAHLLAELRHTESRTLTELQARTADWYVLAGPPMSALPHLLRTPDAGPLRHFLREHALRAVLDGHGSQLFQQIDHGRPACAADPFLRAMRTVQALEQHDIARATAHLDLLLRRPSDTGTIAPNQWLAPLTLAASAEIVVSTGGGLAEFRIPQPLPSTGQPDIDSYTAVQIGTVMMARGDFDSADQQFRRGLALADCTGNARLTVRANGRRAITAGLGGALGRMRQYAQRATAIATDRGLGDSRDARQALAVSAFSEYLRGTDPSTLPAHALLPGHRLPDGSLAPSAGRYAEVVGRLLAFDNAENGYDAAEALRRSLVVLLRGRPLLPAAISQLVPHVVRALLEVNAAHSARMIVDQAATVLGPTIDVGLARSLTVLRDRPKSARALLEPLLGGTRPRHPVSAITAWVVEAGAQDALGNSPQARAAITTAVCRAAPDHLVRPFLDIPGARALLDAHTGTFGHDNGFADSIRGCFTPRPHTRPGLTATELTVLNQLPSGRTAQQIAEILGVSITTVKTHLRGIYTKLGTSSRAGALDLAHRKGLL